MLVFKTSLGCLTLLLQNDVYVYAAYQDFVTSQLTVHGLICNLDNCDAET